MPTNESQSAPNGSPTWTLFCTMLVEEWRMHANLFGPRRFAAFPLFITLLTTTGVYFLTVADVDLLAAITGVHVLVFLFGLQTGTVGFLGRDAMANLLGDTTLLVFTTRTLPISRRTTLSIFVVKDLLFYAIFFLLPLTIAFVPSALGGSLALQKVGLLWVTLVATFAYGIAATLMLVALSTHGRAGRVATLAGAMTLGFAWVSGVDVLTATPWALYETPSLATAVWGLAPIPVLAYAGMRLHDPEYERPARTAPGNQFRRWHTRLRRLPRIGLADDKGLVTRSLLDVHRSSGGFFKVVFSATILFVVSAFLVELVAPIVGTEPSTGVTFGGLLGLSAFTTFNWLTQFDDPREYLRLPLDLADVFAAKRRAFLLASLPVSLGFLALAVGWFGAKPLDVVAGVVLLVGIQLYLFGLVVYLTGFSPNEFLFDTVLFAGFGAAIAVVLVPVLVVGLVVTPTSPTLLAGLVGSAVFAGLLGAVLYRRAIPRWTTAIRNGDV